MTTEAEANKAEARLSEAFKNLSGLLSGAGNASKATLDALAEKYGVKCDDMPMPVGSGQWQPLGGALSFSEAEAYEEAQEEEAKAAGMMYRFNAIANNIMSSDKSADEKATALEAAARDFRTMLMDEDEDGEKATFSAEQRRRLADTGAAMPDGSFPIRNRSDLQNAISAFGRAKDKAAAKRHILKRARALNATGMLPESWGKKTFMDGLKALFGGETTQEASLEPDNVGSAVAPGDGFFVTKDATTGAYRWGAVFTNKYEDRERELFTDDALKEYEAHVDQTKQFPELWPWHLPIRMGEADYIAYDDRGFLVASGTFDPGMEGAAKALAAMPDLGVSHGYSYEERNFHDGQYHQFRTREISPLPKDRAANELTAFMTAGIEEVKMLTPEKKGFIDQVLGTAQADAFVEGIGKLDAAAKESGLTFKEVVGIKDDAPVAVTTPPEPTPDPDPAPDPDQDEPAMIKAVKEVIAPVMAKLIQIEATQAEQQQTIAQLQQKDTDKLADLISPRSRRIDPTNLASAREDNIVKGPDTKEARTAYKGAGALGPYLAAIGMSTPDGE